MLDQALDLHRQSKSLRFIAETLNVSHETIRLILLQSPEYTPSKSRKKRNLSIMFDYIVRHDLKIKEIAVKHNISESRVYAICKGLKRAKRPMGCEKCRVEPYAKGLCKACYERQRRRKNSN